MNENEINGEEFSGAGVSSNIYKVAIAIAIAVATGTKVVYRALSGNINHSSNIIAFLRNQFNGLISQSTTISNSVDIIANAIKIISIRALMTAASAVTAVPKGLKNIISEIVVPAASVIGLLKDQFNGVINQAVAISNTVVISASAFALYQLRSVSITTATVITAVSNSLKYSSAALSHAVSIAANLKNQLNGIITFQTLVAANYIISVRAGIILYFNGFINIEPNIVTGYAIALRNIVSSIESSTTVTAVSTSLKQAVAAISNSYTFIANLSGLAITRSAILYVASLVGLVKSSFKLSTIVQTTTIITANMKSLKNQPASPYNSFNVPSDAEGFNFDVTEDFSFDVTDPSTTFNVEQ
jgi:hypothetical protein